MVSSKSLQPLGWAINLGFWLKMYPGSWDSKTVSVKLPKAVWRIRIPIPGLPNLILQQRNTPLVYISYLTLTILYFIQFFFFQKNSLKEIGFGFIFGTVCSMALGAQIIYYVLFEDFALLINTFLIHDEKFLRMGGQSRTDSDGLELLFQGLVGVVVGSTFASFPLFLLVLSDESFLLFKDIAFAANLIFPWNLSLYVLAGALTFTLCLCWINIVFSAIMMVAYVNSLSNWMVTIRKKWLDHIHLTETKKLTISYYRTAQYIHTLTTEVTFSLIPTVQLHAELLVIASLFVVIRISPTKELILFLFAGSVGFIIFSLLKLGFDFSSKITELSNAFLEVPFLEETAAKCFTKEDRCTFASCRSLALRVGGTFTVTKETFPTISQDIILANLVNLLVLTWHK